MKVKITDKVLAEIMNELKVVSDNIAEAMELIERIEEKMEDEDRS